MSFLIISLTSHSPWFAGMGVVGEWLGGTPAAGGGEITTPEKERFCPVCNE